jgi:hypothetical protein
MMEAFLLAFERLGIVFERRDFCNVGIDLSSMSACIDVLCEQETDQAVDMGFVRRSQARELRL